MSGQMPRKHARCHYAATVSTAGINGCAGARYRAQALLRQFQGVKGMHVNGSWGAALVLIVRCNPAFVIVVVSLCCGANVLLLGCG